MVSHNTNNGSIGGVSLGDDEELVVSESMVLLDDDVVNTSHNDVGGGAVDSSVEVVSLGDLENNDETTNVGVVYSDEELFNIPRPEEPVGSTGDSSHGVSIVPSEDEGSRDNVVPTTIGFIVEEDEEEYEQDRHNTDEYALFPLYPIVGAAIEAGASDIYLKPGSRVAFKVLGRVVWRDDWGVVSEAHLEELFRSVVRNQAFLSFSRDNELDVSYVVRQGEYVGRRCRMNVVWSDSQEYGADHEHAITLRVLNDVIPSPRELGIGDDVLGLTDLPNGLVLFTGATGSGKTSSIAALLGRIQREEAKTVVTIEKPIEYKFENTPEMSSFFMQREVGRDTKSFEWALNSAMRQNPDVILIGEVRDRVEVDAMLRAAESGHLTISTIHSLSAPVTLDRIKSLFEGSEQTRVLSSLASTARGFIAQTLVAAPDGLSRFAVRETLLFEDSRVVDLVRAGDVGGLRDYMVREGITLEHELVRAVLRGDCVERDAVRAASDPLLFKRVLREARESGGMV